MAYEESARSTVRYIQLKIRDKYVYVYVVLQGINYSQKSCFEIWARYSLCKRHKDRFGQNPIIWIDRKRIISIPSKLSQSSRWDLEVVMKCC